MSGGIKNWPTEERPREKLRHRGVTALSDAELLAIILRTGDAASGLTALDLGRELLRRHGTLAHGDDLFVERLEHGGELTPHQSGVINNQNLHFYYLLMAGKP